MKAQARFPRDVRGFQPLEGERVHRILRMHPLCMLGAYGTVLGLLVLATLLALLAIGPGRDLAAWFDAQAGPGALVLLLVIWWGGLAGATLPFALRAAKLWPVAYAVGVAVLGGVLLIVLTAPGPGAARALPLLPWLTLAAVPLPLAVAEARRRSKTWVLTTLRVVRVEGLLHPREESVRLHRIERVAVQRRGPARFDVGDLVLARKGDDEVRIQGVRPVSRARDDVELLLHTAPPAAYLGEQREDADRVRDLLRGS